MNKLNKAFYLKLLLASILVILSSCKKVENGAEITPADFVTYLKHGDVKRVEIVNNREARVYLTVEAAQKEIHKKSRPAGELSAVGSVPNYRFEFGDLRLFREIIGRIIDEDNLDVQLEYKREKDTASNNIITTTIIIGIVCGAVIFLLLVFLIILTVKIQRLSSRVKNLETDNLKKNESS